MAIVVGTGGTAAAAAAAATQNIAALAAVAAAGVTETALAVGSVASSAAVTEGALSIAIAAETVATSVALTNVWNQVGWAVGAVLVSASQHTSQAVTWGCYKPIIGEVETNETSIKPMTLAKLAAHPEVRRVFINANAASANLPEVEATVLCRGVQSHIMRSESTNSRVISA